MTRKKQWFESPIVWVIALVVLAGAVVFVRASRDETPPISEETAAVEVDGAALPRYGFPEEAIGLPAPTISSQTSAGESLVVGDDGTPRLFAFFAHWCPHCQAEVPLVTSWLARDEVPTGVELIAVSTAVDSGAPNYPPSEWFERENWPTAVMLDDEAGTVAASFGLTGFPYWVAVDAEGKVAARVSGSIDETQFRDLLATVAAGQP